MDHGNLKELRSLDLDSSDNLTEETLQHFVQVIGPQLDGNVQRLLWLTYVMLCYSMLGLLG